jgi:hypothetical protein
MSGNIRVICRLRPENNVERESGGHCCVEYDEYAIKLNLPAEKHKPPEVHEFTFDRICGPETSQAEVFEYAARPVVAGVLDGYNGTIFAYGQTGSGKTFSMEGPNIHDPQYKGIIPRMMDAIFEGLINASSSCEFSIKVSYLEIYLEKIQDLIDSSKNNLQVREDKSRGIYVQDATEVYVGSPDEMMNVMTMGSKNRSVAATRMNQRSSRSHSIFCVYVEQRDIENNARKNGRLYFVDLAGSEKIAKTHVQGKQLEEAKMINKSLSALGNVINALTEKGNSCVPYRDSKLTRILQESLGGNSQTTLVIACSMSSYNDKETLSTLRFGLRAKKIQNKPICNQEKSAKELVKQLEQVQKEMQKQAEIINNIQTHVQQKYSSNANLLEEINGIIDNSFTVSKETTQPNHESEHSMTLVKQHVEIVSLNEELQKIKLEKKELEDELLYRNKENTDYISQIAELQLQLQDIQLTNQQQIEKVQIAMERALFENQQQILGMKRLKKACERLKSDIMILRNEIPNSQSNIGNLILQSINETLPILTEIEFSFYKDTLGLNSQGTEEEVRSRRCLNKSLPDLRYLGNTSETSTVCDERNTHTDDIPDEAIDEVRKLVSEQRETIDILTQQNNCLHLENESLQGLIGKLDQKSSELSKEIETLKGQMEEHQENTVRLEKQLELKVKNIEEERASNVLEIKYRDEQINELQTQLAKEREQLENLLKLDTPKKRMVENENNIREIQLERQKVIAT